MKISPLLAFATSFLVVGCGTTGRILMIKSEPADADICIKGKARSEYFSNTKTCVGTTPFEADRVEVKSPDGDSHTVKFKDIETDKESFYVVISRQGYASQAVEVPGWEHFVALKPEGSNSAPAAAPQSSAPQAPAEKGTVKIASEPIGALVYLNDALKGNTPFTYEGLSGPVKLRLELEGYEPLEKTITVESGSSISVNFKLLTHKQAAKEAAAERPVQTAPIKIQKTE